MKPIPRRVAAVLAGAAIGFTVFYMGGLAYGKLTVGDPLDRVFADSTTVISHTVVKRGPSTTVEVVLADVPDLRAEVKQLEDKSAAVTKGQTIDIEVGDARDEALSEAYYSMHYDIQEALVTGKFTEMSSRLSSLAADAGLDRYRVFVDDDRVFVQLHQDGHYLYEVLPRHSQGQANPRGV